MSDSTAQMATTDSRPSEVTPENLPALRANGWVWNTNLQWPLNAPTVVQGVTNAGLLRELREEYGAANVLLGVPHSPQTKSPDWEYRSDLRYDEIGVYVRPERESDTTE